MWFKVDTEELGLIWFRENTSEAVKAAMESAKIIGSIVGTEPDDFSYGTGLTCQSSPLVRPTDSPDKCLVPGCFNTPGWGWSVCDECRAYGCPENLRLEWVRLWRLSCCPIDYPLSEKHVAAFAEAAKHYGDYIQMKKQEATA